MNRSEKETFLAEFTKEVSHVQALAVLAFHKITVEQMTQLRLGLRRKNIRARVVKNTLARRVLENTDYKDLANHFRGTTMVIYGDGDPVATTKAVWEWIGKEELDLKVKAGLALGKVISAAELKELSSLPGRPEMLTGFLFALTSLPSQVLYALQDAPTKVLYALEALKEKQATSQSGTQSST